MEARMQPRTDDLQRCLHFALTTTPKARVMMYQDHDGNAVHHFAIPARHAQLMLTAESLVDSTLPEPLPADLGGDGWARLDVMKAAGDFWEYLSPSSFVQKTALLDELRREIGLDRGDDPLVTVRRLMNEIYERFEYAPQVTRVDSPIDDALRVRRGVCQDFAHIFLALARLLGVPSRYVSGYLFQGGATADQTPSGATHAWVEVRLPDLGWIGLDPANNVLAEERHVRVAVGRDYADVPPTRGIFKGTTVVRSELRVTVDVGPARPLPGDVIPFAPWMSREASETPRDADVAEQQQQQQQ
jgi:transglutaminase-like putative cysteine protease